jgi:hypothetical protein
LEKDGAYVRSGARRAAIKAAGEDSQEITMLTLSPSQATSAIKFECLNWLATDPLPRDQAQSQRLHEPEHPNTTIDPGYRDTPLDHPSLRLPYPATDDDDRGG